MTAQFSINAVRLAGAIVCNTAALLFWDIGTRSPSRLVADIRAGLPRLSTVFRGTLRFTIGAFALLAGVALSAPITIRRADFTVVECLTLVTALAVEQLIGARFRPRFK